MGSYEPPSLEPLVISPAMLASAQQHQQPAQEAPNPAPAEAENVENLKAMFPDFDPDVLASILAAENGNMDAAVQQLLEMGSDPPPREAAMGGLDSDEELAMALFKQFAEDLVGQLGVPIPDDVRNDPLRYEQFVREHFEKELSRPDSQLTARAQTAIEQRGGQFAEQYEQRGGRQGFLERMKGFKLSGGSTKKVSMISVDQGAQPLLASDHSEPQERV